MASLPASLSDVLSRRRPQEAGGPAPPRPAGPELRSRRETFPQYLRNKLVGPKSSPEWSSIVDQLLGTGAVGTRPPFSSIKDINLQLTPLAPDVEVGTQPTEEEMLKAGLGWQTGVLTRSDDLANILRARRMREQLIPEPQVYQQTGQWLSPYGPIREISDVGMRTIDPRGLPQTRTTDLPLPKAVEHPELYRQIPEARNWEWRYDPTYENEAGWNPGTKRLTIGPNISDVRGVTSHELTHGVADLQDLPPGSNPQYEHMRIDIPGTRANKSYLKLKHQYPEMPDDLLRWSAAQVSYMTDPGENLANISRYRARLPPDILGQQSLAQSLRRFQGAWRQSGYDPRPMLRSLSQGKPYAYPVR